MLQKDQSDIMEEKNIDVMKCLLGNAEGGLYGYFVMSVVSTC